MVTLPNSCYFDGLQSITARTPELWYGIAQNTAEYQVTDRLFYCSRNQGPSADLIGWATGHGIVFGGYEDSDP